jgi:hypothetical protein
MTLNVGLGVSFNNMHDYAGIRENVGEVNGTQVSLTNDRIPFEF